MGRRPPIGLRDQRTMPETRIIVLALRGGCVKSDKTRPRLAHFTIITLEGASSTSRCVVLRMIRMYSADLHT
jgi:hypothetical protein